MSVAPKTARFDNVAQLLRRLGVAARRVSAFPPIGEATERDLLSLHVRTDRLYELVHGVLVEKVSSLLASALTCDVIYLLQAYLQRNPRGYLTGPDGPVRLQPGLVRMPDVSLFSWDDLPKRERPTEAIAGLAPALAVEVLSKGNTKREMDRKVREYFLSGVRLVWLVSLTTRSVRVHTAPDQSVTLTEAETLDGGAVLPGLALPLRRVFAEVPAWPQGKKRRRS